MKVKQVIVFRGDLKVRKGKFASQVAHASMKILLDKMNNEKSTRTVAIYNMEIRQTSPLNQWLTGLFTKIVAKVDSEDELLEIEKKALDAGLDVALITDAGLTEFNGVPTHTCIAIGPDKAEKIDKITGHLKLM